MAKTNKSFLKRIRVTRTGKAMKRAPGQNHFNAKERRVKQLGQKGISELDISKKVVKKYLPYL
jgi:ribosomal protein L35